MSPVPIYDDEYERLCRARDVRKYGHLATWKELYIFQRTLATPGQIKEIGGFAARKNRGEYVYLPLKDFVEHEQMI